MESEAQAGTTANEMQRDCCRTLCNPIYKLSLWWQLPWLLRIHIAPRDAMYNAAMTSLYEICNPRPQRSKPKSLMVRLHKGHSAIPQTIVKIKITRSLLMAASYTVASCRPRASWTSETLVLDSGYALFHFHTRKATVSKIVSKYFLVLLIQWGDAWSWPWGPTWPISIFEWQNRLTCL